MLTTALTIVFLLAPPMLGVWATNSFYEIRRDNDDALSRFGWGLSFGFSAGMLLDLLALAIGYPMLDSNIDLLAPRIAFAFGAILTIAACYGWHRFLVQEDTQASYGMHSDSYFNQYYDDTDLRSEW